MLFYAVLLVAFAYPAFLLWCWTGWIRTKHGRPNDIQPDNPLQTIVSVIIPVRNEACGIYRTLSGIMKQRYPADIFEVIVVNDHSTDDTAAELNSFLERHSEYHNICVLNLTDKSVSSKKRAITAGIEKAKGELIVITDADTSRGEFWLHEIAACYERHKPMLICGPLKPIAGGNWFGKLQALELAGLTVITGGAIANRQPVLCNGANIAYPKKVFEMAGGYDDDKVSSGDDTALMKKIAAIDASRIYFLKARHAGVMTDTKNTLGELISQRRRWASKVTAMSNLAIFIAIAAVLYHGLLLIFLVAALSGMGSEWLLWLLAVKIVAELPVLASATNFYQSSKLLLLFLPAQLIYPFYLLVVGISSQFGKYEWKGRKISIDN